MTVRIDYTTLTDVRANGLGETGTTDDPLLLQFIRTASNDINDIAAGRSFIPTIETRYYDAPIFGWSALRAGYYSPERWGSPRAPLLFDCDVLEVLSFTNGDGTAIASTEYVLDPYNETPKNKLLMLPTSTVTLLPNAKGEYLKALSIQMVRGFHSNYADAWVDSTTTLAAAITTTTATTFTSSSGPALKAGWLAKIDSEWLYLSSIATNTVTVVRGVNGSTAATHLIGATVYYWEVMYSIQTIAMQAATLYYNLRKNPGVAMIVDGHTIAKPEDVKSFITNSLDFLGRNRGAFA